MFWRSGCWAREGAPPELPGPGKPSRAHHVPQDVQDCLPAHLHGQQLPICGKPVDPADWPSVFSNSSKNTMPFCFIWWELFTKKGQIRMTGLENLGALLISYKSSPEHVTSWNDLKLCFQTGKTTDHKDGTARCKEELETLHQQHNGQI